VVSSWSMPNAGTLSGNFFSTKLSETWQPYLKARSREQVKDSNQWSQLTRDGLGLASVALFAAVIFRSVFGGRNRTFGTMICRVQSLA